jgi:hypothetical protein
MGIGSTGADEKIICKGAYLVDFEKLNILTLLFIQSLGDLIGHFFCT